MNHDDDELFRRLEAELDLTGDPDAGAVLDLSKARAARHGSPDSPADPGPDSTPDRSPDSDPDGSVYLPADESAVRLVDSPAPTGPGWWARARAAKPRPVLPAWATSRTEFETAALWLAKHTLHSLAFHAVRLPWYAAVLALRAPGGFFTVLARLLRWAWDSESEALRQVAATRNDPDDYLKLSHLRDGRVRSRWILLGLGLALGPVLALIAYVVLPSWAFTLAAAAILAAFGWVNIPKDKPLISRAVVATEVERLTSTVVERALGALGIAEINKALGKGGEGIRFPAPITRDGPGWRADVDLPYGVTVTDILDRRDRLASGLRRPLGCVWPEPVPDEHAGRMMLWVGDRALNQVPPNAGPLAKAAQTSLFQPIPFGTDQRGRPVTLSLMYDNVLIGAMPGMGKTFSLRVPLLAAALDPTAELLVWELKGTGDLAPLREVAADYGSGPDDDTKAAALQSIRYVYAELERRAKVISGLPKELCPENKVTAQLAAKKSLGLHPLVLAVDECQELFADEKVGKEAGALCTAIIKRGRALGVMLLLATQRPDRDSLPTAISANVGTRYCLRVMGQVENDMVLGTSAYKNGIRATSFVKKDKGIGYLVGAGDDPQIVRSYYIDTPAAEAICKRARAARIAAGTLAGIAAGQTPQRGDRHDTLLDDILAVVPPSEPKVWSETLAARLAELRPEVYDGWTPEQVASALAPMGVETIQINRRIDGKNVNRRGIQRSDISDAVTKRDRNRDAG
ncbi:cell division protein FtsK [Streptacidiphilus monticola]|uniref:Cell division protein FtsK n=1 Tax=Streptacidiphilus monticola TaxID=2161674 RepID=A0ABW1GD37_9ACTN